MTLLPGCIIRADANTARGLERRERSGGGKRRKKGLSEVRKAGEGGDKKGGDTRGDEGIICRG